MPKLDGIWFGPLKVQATEIRVAFHVSAKDKEWTAKFDSLDQGLKGAPVEKVTYKDGVVRFDLKAGVVFFEGTLIRRYSRCPGSTHRMRRCASSFAYVSSAIAGKFHDRHRTDSAVYCRGNFQRRQHPRSDQSGHLEFVEHDRGRD